MRVVAVVVAYNRRDLLVAALDALAAQSRPPEQIVVVDNGSTDGSGETARNHPAGPHVIVLGRNTGGAGGFAAGIAQAVEALRADAVWLMDDDTVPTPTALAELLAAWRAYGPGLTLAASRAVWTDGRTHPMNHPRPRRGASRLQRMRAAKAGAIPVRSASFVSLLIAADAVRRHGLPVADYFLWNDDFEYTCRLLRHGVGIVVPTSVVEHRTVRFAGPGDDPGDRFFYEVRNKIWLFTRARVLVGIDWVAYTAATLVRWTRTLARSRSRGTLLRAGWRGLRAGVRHGPRPTSRVLADIGAVSRQVVLLDAGADSR